MILTRYLSLHSGETMITSQALQRWGDLHYPTTPQCEFNPYGSDELGIDLTSSHVFIVI